MRCCGHVKDCARHTWKAMAHLPAPPHPTSQLACTQAHTDTPPAFVHTPILRKESTVSMKPARSPAGRQQVGAAGAGIRRSSAAVPHLQAGSQAGALLLLPSRYPATGPRTTSPSPLTAHLRRLDWLLALQHFSRGAVKGQPVALLEGAAPQDCGL